MKSIYETLGSNIRNLRKSFGWSQATLAEKADISVPYMTMIEWGKRSASLETIQIIARAFGISVAALFEEEILPDVVTQNKNYTLEQFEKKLREDFNTLLDGSIEQLKKDLE